MIMNRLVDWDAVYRAAQSMMAGQANSPFVQDPTKLGTSAAANRQLLYPTGTATTPRSNALTPGVFAPGAGYQPGPGMMPAPGAVPSSTPQPYAVQGYQTLQASGAGGAPASMSAAPFPAAAASGSGQPSGAAPSGGLPSGPGAGGEPSERVRVNDMSKMKPGETMSWTPWVEGMETAGGTASRPHNGAIAYSTAMPPMPGLGSNDPAKGQWRYMGNDPAQFGAWAAGGEQPRPDGMKGVWQWEDAPTAKTLPGLRELLMSMFGQGQQVPDSMPSAPSGGMLPNNGGMAPGGIPPEYAPPIAPDVKFSV